MADDRNIIRRRREAPERIGYREALEGIRNFVDNELGNGQAPQRPDTTEWRVQRAKTIRTLNELREKLDTVCVGTNYGTAVGNVSEIVGAAARMTGALLSLFRIPSGEIFINVGNMALNGGNLVAGVSNVIECIFSAKYLREIEAVLERDQELSRPLFQWLNHSRRLDAYIIEIFGVSLASAKWNIVSKVFCEFYKVSRSAKSFDASINLMRQGRYSVHIGGDVKLEKLQEFFQQLSTFPNLAGTLSVAFSVLSAGAGAFQVYRDGAQVYRSITGTSSVTVIPTLQGGLNPEIPTTRAVSAFCVFQAISMAISVISLMNAAKIIRDGHSKYSDALQNLTSALTSELLSIENL